MKVEVPDGVADGAGKVGIAVSRNAPIETTDDGVRYVEIDSPTAARSVMRQWAQRYDVTYTDDGRLSGGSWGDGGDDDLAALDAADLTDEHWQVVKNAVADGTLDDVLDELADVETRDSVLSAISDRKAELV